MGLLHFFHMLQRQRGRSGSVGPSQFSFQQILSLLQMHKYMCPDETVLHSTDYAEELIQLGAGIQAFCPSERRLLFVVQNLFQTAAWDPSASDLPRISRAGDLCFVSHGDVK